MRHYLFGAANQRAMAYDHEAIRPLQTQIRRALYDVDGSMRRQLAEPTEVAEAIIEMADRLRTHGEVEVLGRQVTRLDDEGQPISGSTMYFR